VVKYFPDRGYGFIQPDQAGKNIFFHDKARGGAHTEEYDFWYFHAEVTLEFQSTSYEPVKVGDRLVFRTRQETKGIVASPWVHEWVWNEAVEAAIQQQFRVVRCRTATRKGRLVALKPEVIFTGTVAQLLDAYPREDPTTDVLAPMRQPSGFQSICEFQRLIGDDWVECKDPRQPPLRVR
jgi:hypothetical protein